MPTNFNSNNQSLLPLRTKLDLRFLRLGSYSRNEGRRHTMGLGYNGYAQLVVYQFRRGVGIRLKICSIWLTINVLK